MKTKKNEEYKKSQITKMSIFGFTFFIKNYILLKNMVLKGKKVKSSLYHHISCRKNYRNLKISRTKRAF